MAVGGADKVKIYFDIYYAINFIRKVQHNKPSKEKAFSYLRKLDKDFSYDLFNISMETLVKDNFIEVQGDDDQESLFFVKEFDEVKWVLILLL